MTLVQRIVHNAYELEEADGVVNAWTGSINYPQGLQATSNATMFGASMAATGDGTVIRQRETKSSKSYRIYPAGLI